jgi:outer membrane protein assembly factor BamB
MGRFPIALKWLCLSLVAAIILACDAAATRGQWGGMATSSRFELGENVQLDQVDHAVLAQWERAKALLADRQWDEPVEILRQLAESPDEKLLGVTAHRFISLRAWCHLQAAALPPEALMLYRSRVDPVAKKWYEQGIAQHNERLLANVVDQAFASSFGDDALWALGEIALEKADYAAARWYWERILPPGKEGPEKKASAWPGYPDTSLDVAAVRARLVLVSILEGAADSARAELTGFTRLHPEARGRLGGREGKYSELLHSLLAAGDTGAGKPGASGALRDRGGETRVDVGAVAWRERLRPEIPSLDHAAAERSLGESFRAPLSFYPLVAGDTVFVNDSRQILALRRSSGQPAWGQAAIYRSEQGGAAAPLPSETLGVPRFTLTVLGNRLLARMGSPLTGECENASAAFGRGYLVCLDLSAEGRLLWKVEPEEGWAFEGSPVADENGVYVAMRRHDIRPRAFVACLDADSGRQRWRRFICSAETPARGVLCETTHNLLTLGGGRLYYNTNLGAVAALETEGGRLLWVSLYPRAQRGDLATLAPHWRRDSNPCILERGAVLAAPADSPSIFAFDAATGQPLWQTGSETEDASALLGVAQPWLIAAGRKLYWISMREEDRGRVKCVWPDGVERPGYGRGLLCGANVLWPTRDKLYVFDARTARPRKAIDLRARSASGGNLLVAGGRLLVATESELLALDWEGGDARIAEDIGRGSDGFHAWMDGRR